MVKKKLVKKKTIMCPYNGKPLIAMGIVLLVISIVLYLGYGLREILGVLGILTLLKGLYLYTRK